MNQLLAERLRIYRLKKGISQQKLGILLSVSQQAVGKWEKGIAEPDSLTLNKLANYFGITVDYLLGRTDSPNLATPNEIQGIEIPFSIRINMEDLNVDQIEDVLNYIDYIKYKKDIAYGKSKNIEKT